MSTLDFVPILALVILIKKMLDFLRYLSAQDWNAVVTQLIAWVGGVGGVMLAAQTDWAGGIVIGDFTLENLSAWSLVFVGLTISSGASFIHDATKAVDNTDSAAVPTLLRK